MSGFEAGHLQPFKKPMLRMRVRELCEIQSITSWVQRRRTEWSEHVSRMADARLFKKVHDGIPEGKRNRGRPLKRWRDALE